MELGNSIKKLIAAGCTPELAAEICTEVYILGAHSTKPVRTARKRNNYSEQFEAFWKAYPTDSNMAKFEAWGEWERLPEDDRAAAVSSAPGFADYCRKHPNYRPVHACRYLSYRRFEAFALSAAAPSHLIAPGTEAWDAWRAHYVAKRLTFRVGLMDTAQRERKDFYAPADWPPRAEVTTEAMANP